MWSPKVLREEFLLPLVALTMRVRECCFPRPKFLVGALTLGVSEGCRDALAA